MGPLLSGGGIVDADLQRAAGEAGHDAFGRMALFYTPDSPSETTKSARCRRFASRQYADLSRGVDRIMSIS